jgi:hypothetical protein
MGPCHHNTVRPQVTEWRTASSMYGSCKYIMIWYDMIWYDTLWYDMIRYDMIWYMIWYDMIWYDMIWYDMIWYDMIWYDIYLTAIGLTPGGSSTVHIYTQKIILNKQSRETNKGWSPSLGVGRGVKNSSP